MTDIPSPLEFASTNDLVTEISKRHRGVLVAVVGRDGDPEYIGVTYCGGTVQALGLVQIASDEIRSQMKGEPDE